MLTKLLIIAGGSNSLSEGTEGDWLPQYLFIHNIHFLLDSMMLMTSKSYYMVQNARTFLGCILLIFNHLKMLAFWLIIVRV